MLTVGGLDLAAVMAELAATWSALSGAAQAAIWMVLAAAVLLAGLALRRRRRARPRARPVFHVIRPASSATDPGLRQIDSVAGGDYQVRPLLNASERRLWPELAAAVRDLAPGCRLMAQVALGEVLATRGCREGAAQDAAFAAINAKRLDFAVFAPDWTILLAIEYQGHGHHMSARSFVRDAIKREALRKARVRMLEIEPDWTTGSLRQQLGVALSAAQAARSGGGAP